MDISLKWESTAGIATCHSLSTTKWPPVTWRTKSKMAGQSRCVLQYWSEVTAYGKKSKCGEKPLP